MRKCGLKYIYNVCPKVRQHVTSLAEVWIEIFCIGITVQDCMVTSLAEVWIEIVLLCKGNPGMSVTSLAEVWIEICSDPVLHTDESVTSLAEVWIEIRTIWRNGASKTSHFPCGSVD